MNLKDTMVAITSHKGQFSKGQRPIGGTTSPHTEVGGPLATTCCGLGTDANDHAEQADRLALQIQAAIRDGDYDLASELIAEYTKELELMSEAMDAYMMKCSGHSLEDHCNSPSGTAH